MSNALENHDDIRRLLDREYSLSIIGGYVVVNDVYHLDAEGQLQRGRLAAPLNQPTPETLGPPHNHQMYWSGSDPHYADGTEISGLGNGAVDLTIGGVSFRRHLSNKPPEGFETYTLLIEHYVSLIAGPAEMKCGVSARTGATYDVPAESSPFKVRDTASARAEITDLNRRLEADKIAVIGLGGTGAFVLDFLVKTPVAAIVAYDLDTMKVHNAFRAPGEAPMAEFGHPKVEVYKRKYEPFRHQLTFLQKRIDSSDGALFCDTTFAFVCIDDGEARAEICELLVRLGVAFIDVGMGVEKEGGTLDGLIRTTIFTADTAASAIDRVPLDRRREGGDYRIFVQIAELNALNAALAVIRYKQSRGFYADENGYMETLFSIGSSKLFGIK